MSECPPHLSVNSVQLWLGNQCTRNSGHVLDRKNNESFYSYLSRWLAMKRFKLEWRVETFPYAQPGKQTIYRPIVNGCELAACYCGQGDIEAIAKEESCQSLVVAIGCKL